MVKISTLILPVIILFSCTNTTTDSAGDQANVPQDSTKKSTHITLAVNTDELKPDPQRRSADAGKSVKISDNRGGISNPGNHNQFVTFVTPDSLVYWKGFSKNKKHKVVVTNIIPKENEQLDLIQNITFRPDSSYVRAKAKSQFQPKKNSYTIEFMVINENNDTSKYFIDPILRMINN
ncbi:MAG: hypothetical protein ACNS60_16755 [Candidatus Cyclobacteriaceae bacterium M2_1C_046]